LQLKNNKIFVAYDSNTLCIQLTEQLR